METTFIYLLRDPENPNKGYVGKSDNPKKRFREHLKDSRRKSYCTNWIFSLAERGLSPVLEIIDEVPFEHWAQLEVAYIEFFLEQGYELTNGTPGGDCGPILFGEAHPSFGKKLSSEQLLKITGKNHHCFGKPGTMLGKKHAPGWGDMMRLKLKGRRKPAGFSAKLSAARLGTKTKRRSSNFLGVFKRSAGGWQSSIRALGKRIHIGTFSDETTAAKAYDAAAKSYHGEYAKLNFP